MDLTLLSLTIKVFEFEFEFYLPVFLSLSFARALLFFRCVFAVFVICLISLLFLEWGYLLYLRLVSFCYCSGGRGCSLLGLLCLYLVLFRCHWGLVGWLCFTLFWSVCLRLVSFCCSFWWSLWLLFTVLVTCFMSFFCISLFHCFGGGGCLFVVASFVLLLFWGRVCLFVCFLLVLFCCCFGSRGWGCCLFCLWLRFDPCCKTCFWCCFFFSFSF